ncbi:MAG: deoxyribodipyrimidine photo-lyase [Pseudomonadota bacterium]|nr:deoxyribodipyrimidine photo-lyase [Pseudomonadota bacterium]
MSEHSPIRVHWFRRDLRLTDNPALSTGSTRCLPLYILDPAELSRMGGASKVWLYHSLTALNQSLNGALHIALGTPNEVFTQLSLDHQIAQVTWTRRYDPDAIALDQPIMEMLKDKGVEVTSTNGSLLWEPWEVNKPDGTPYRVFTPFFKRGCLATQPPRAPLPAPQLETVRSEGHSPDLAQHLLPEIPWDKDVVAGWTPGEAGAKARLDAFISTNVANYKAARNIPSLSATSRLAPHLHFGEVSPNQIWHAIETLKTSVDTYHFKSELGWREFSYHLLYRHPDLATENLNKKFDTFPWLNDETALQRWQKGQTGIPIVDAGMRELWQTGYMHNRVRMIVASFLIKNLRIHWREGLAWFHDTLFDADPANNAASWQWVAGSGADAAPYFRIFNPVTQAQKFDPDAIYIKQYVPELADLTAKHAHAPWLAPDAVKATIAGSYPAPLVDLKESRQAALDAFKALP